MPGALLAISAFAMVLILMAGGFVIWFVIRVGVDLGQWFREEVLEDRRIRKLKSQSRQQNDRRNKDDGDPPPS